MNDRIERDHRRIKQRIRPMLRLKSLACADSILGGIKVVLTIRKGRLEPADARIALSADQFERLST